MKAYTLVRYVAFAIIPLLIVILSSCNATRYLTNDQALVKKVTLNGIDKQYQEKVYEYVQKDIRPNSRFKLALYNTFNTRKGKYRTDKIKTIGEAPHLLDSSLVEISANEIKKYLNTKGFFKAEVKSEIKVKNKKAYITFNAERGPVFLVRNFSYDIADSAVKKLYESNRNSFTKIRTRKRYDMDSVMHEITNINDLMKRNGYYDFQMQYSRVNLDSNLNSSQVDVKLIVGNPVDKVKHQVYKLDSTFITITNSDGKEEGKPSYTVVDSQHVFYDFSNRFKGKPIDNYIFLRKGDLYNIDIERLTVNRLYNLNVFKNLKVEYIRAGDSVSLKPKIVAIPLKRMSNRIEGEYTFNSGRNGFTIGNTYTNRNVFGGAEQLDLKVRYGILFDSGISGKAFNRLFNRDIQIGGTLTVPRLLVPFKTRSVNGIPHTTLSSSVQLFDQVDALKNRIFVNSITYDWVETKYKLHSLTPVNVEYRNGKLDPELAAALEAQGNGLYVRTNNRSYVNIGSQYTYTYNGLRLTAPENFIYFKVSGDVAGNTLGNLKSKRNGERTIFKQPYLQYAKTEIDTRLYRNLGTDRQFILRLNPGIIYSYGNFAKALPFEKNFYVGGSSGVRAWQSRTLGPGIYNRSSIKDEATRKNLRFLDQLGEIKLEGNLEYRFNLVNNFFGAKLKGAAFTDFGNVWRLSGDTENGQNGVFKASKFLNQLAIGAGGGLRFDLDYFVLRFDAGIKVRDPQFIDPQYGKSRWVIRHLFDSKQFKDEYYLTNAPDIYRFVQYNFGIGMPF